MFVLWDTDISITERLPFSYVVNPFINCLFVRVCVASASAVAENKPIVPVRHADNPIVFMDIEIAHVSKGRIFFEVEVNVLLLWS